MGETSRAAGLTWMEKEAREAPKIIARQLMENASVWEALQLRLKELNTPYVGTIARGSSDHAATYAKYLIETKANLPVVSIAPSVMTLYGSHLKLHKSLVMAFSQSGKSPDICEAFISAKHSGALTVAVINQTLSPLAEAADYVVPIWAGEEVSVAATKSYLGTLSAIAQFVAVITADPVLNKNLDFLPERLAQAFDCDGSALIELLENKETQKDILIVGRGYGYPIAQEAALKCKETCALHAEAFSTAEVLHGPFALIKPNFPVIFFAQNDPSFEANIALAQRVKSLGGVAVIIANRDQAHRIPPNSCDYLLLAPASLHPALDPLLMIQFFYLTIEKLARARGLDPDKPEHLKKITETR